MIILEKVVSLQRKHKGNMEDKDKTMASEPAAASLSKSVCQSGLLGRVMSLSHDDKVALVAYLKSDIEKEEPFRMDEFGRIVLTKEMQKAAHQAERDLESGKCLNEEAFQKRFAKWL